MNRKSHHGKACPYCGRLMDLGSVALQPTRDHIVPQSRGGRAVVICCSKCNAIKADMMPEVWAAYMAANPGWWMMTRAERRARARSARGLGQPLVFKRRQRQGSPPAPPVIVPPELIWD